MSKCDSCRRNICYEDLMSGKDVFRCLKNKSPKNCLSYRSRKWRKRIIKNRLKKFLGFKIVNDIVYIKPDKKCKDNCHFYDKDGCKNICPFRKDKGFCSVYEFHCRELKVNEKE